MGNGGGLPERNLVERAQVLKKKKKTTMLFCLIFLISRYKIANFHLLLLNYVPFYHVSLLL